MRKLFVALAILVAVALIGMPVFAAGTSEQQKQLTVGVVIPYEIGWFTAFHKGFQLIAERENVKVVWGYHNYKADEETTAVQNMITLGVDGINVTAVTPASAEYSCRLANEAKIPIQITESGIAEGKGQPFADIDFNWFDVYRTVAQGLQKDVKKDMNVLWIQGFAGTPPVMQGDQGFKDTISKIPNIKLATAPQDGQYATAPSLEITKTMVEGGLDFNVAIGGCQEITDGIIQGLKEENKPGVTIVTINGGPMDVENFKKGTLDYALSQSPGLHGMICAQNLINYLKGKDWQKKTYSPIIWITKDNWQQKLIPWEVDASWFPVVDQFVKTGQYKPELRK